jgi:hypothetical protein
MQAITTIGLEIAKSVFQVHGVDAEGNVILRCQLKRRYALAFFQKLPPCRVGADYNETIARLSAVVCDLIDGALSDREMSLVGPCHVRGHATSCLKLGDEDVTRTSRKRR